MGYENALEYEGGKQDWMERRLPYREWLKRSSSRFAFW